MGKLSNEAFRLYLVTDRRWAASDEAFLDAVTASVEGGVTMVQLREKRLETGEFVSLASRLMSRLADFSVPLIINDRIDVALAVKADGVHLGKNDMPLPIARKILGDGFLIGKSTNTIEDAEEALRQSADYIGLGAIQATKTKADHNRVITPSGVAPVAERIGIPIVGIGGIDKENAAQVIAHGADGIAVVSAILAKDNAKDAAMAMRQAVEDGFGLRKRQGEGD